MEQLVARRAHNPKVIGSSPVPATKKSQSEMIGFFHFKTFANPVGSATIAYNGFGLGEGGDFHHKC